MPKLPPVPKPPHDPRWLQLGGGLDWRQLRSDGTTVDPLAGCLMLSLESGERSPGEASGSLGGLAPPTYVAIDHSGIILLLDTTSSVLRVWDGHDCVFRPLPCIGEMGDGPRQFQDPGGIAVGAGNLVVADTGNRRLGVFALKELVLRGFWAPPESEPALRAAWMPVDVAFGGCGCTWVADPGNGGLHKFSATGRWLQFFGGLGDVTAVSIDLAGRLHVLRTLSDEVVVLSADGNELERVTTVDALRGRFPELPFRVDSDGNLDFGPRCGAFDHTGARLEGGAVLDDIVWHASGTWISQPLDSKIPECKWHRVLLDGCIPEGTSVRVSTYTSQLQHSAELILGLDEEVWTTSATARDVDGTWDCLVRSEPGRYLWLRLEAAGPGTTTPKLESIVVEYPRISLRRFLPAVFGEDPAGGDFLDRFLSLFDTSFRSIERIVDQQAELFDLDSTPASGNGIDFLTWLAGWIGLSADRNWPDQRRRAFLQTALSLQDRRGTPEGLRRLLLGYLGMDAESVACEGPSPEPHCPVEIPPCEARSASFWQPPQLVLEHFMLRRWLFVGSGRLGDDAVLWGQRIVNRAQLDAGTRLDEAQLIGTQDPYRDPFHVFASTFSVFVPKRMVADDHERRSLETLIRNESPAHTRFFLCPVGPRFRIGVQSMIGLDSVVGCYPEGLVLEKAVLDRTTVLGDGTGKTPAPTLRIGVRSQVGATTQLD